MKIIVQCAGRKDRMAGSFLFSGKKVKFVSRPEIAALEEATDFSYFRPDDVNPDSGKTWREMLVEYNAAGGNLLHLLPAVDLYGNSIYKATKHYAAQISAELYILSAGWGLVRAEFLLPDYNITFARQSNIPKYAIRTASAKFNDFNQVRPAGPEEEVHFFGGKDYLPLFCSLTADLGGRKIIHHHGGLPIKQESFEYLAFTPAKPQRKTNWHYECLRRFIERG